MKNKITFTEAVNWEWVNYHHQQERDGLVKPGPWCQRVIDHARSNEYAGKITERGACRIINSHLL